MLIPKQTKPIQRSGSKSRIPAGVGLSDAPGCVPACIACNLLPFPLNEACKAIANATGCHC